MAMLFTSSTLFAQDSNAPDMALLEFLGEGVKVGKEVVDPMTWQAMEAMTRSNQDKPQQVRQEKDQRQQDSRHGHE